MTTDPRSTRSRLPLLIVFAAALAAVVLIAFMLPRGGQTDALPAQPSATVVDSPTPSATSVSALPSPSASPSPSVTPNNAPAECTDPGGGFVPTRFAIPAMGADERVVSLNLDADGNIAAPPKDEPRTASWWNAGPMPGSEQGKALLSIHTYRTGKALGNELYSDAGPQLAPGDLIKLYSDDGRVQCYEFTEATKVWVDDYDPQSDVMVDYEGDPELAIIICWDFNRSNEVWESRIFFYATPIIASS